METTVLVNTQPTELTLQGTQYDQLAFPLPLGLAGNTRNVDEISVRSTASSKLKKRVKRSSVRRDAQSEGPPRRSNRARQPVKRIDM